MIRDAVQEERTPIKPARVPEPATEAARELQRKMSASAAYANRAFRTWHPVFSTKSLPPTVSSSQKSSRSTDSAALRILRSPDFRGAPRKPFALAGRARSTYPLALA
jgi:hypothetical protein